MEKSELFKAIIDGLKSGGVKFCVLRSYEDIPDRIYNDVDVLVLQEHAPKFKKIVESVSENNGWVPWLKPRKYNDCHYVIQRYNEKKDDMETLSLDANFNLTEKGVVYVPGAEALNGTVPYKDFFILPPEYELVHLLVHASFGSPTSRGYYHKKILQLLETKVPPGKAAAKWAYPVSRSIKRALENHEVEKATSIARRGYLFFLFKNKSLLFRTREWFKKQGQRVWRRVSVPGNFIVIAGPDGVGKSTTARILSRLIEERYVIAKHLHLGFRPAVLPARKKKGRSDGEKSSIGEFARFIYHALDYVLGYWTEIRPVRARNGIVVAERYFYDYLVRLQRKKISIRKSVVEAVFKLFLPKPDVFVLLENEYKVVKNRRNDLSEEEMKEQVGLLRYWGKKSPYFLSLKTDESPGNIAFKIAGEVFPRRRYL